MSYQKPFLKINFFFFVIIATAFYSCSDDQIRQTELAENRHLWESYQIANYSINAATSCYCGGVLDWELTVEDGIKIAVDFDESLLPIGENYNTILERARTINDIFDFIESLENQNVESLVVQYDTDYGFPTLISIDYRHQVADDEFVYSYTNFNLLN